MFKLPALLMVSPAYLIWIHQENLKLLIFYLICLNPLNLKLSKIKEEKRRGLDLFFLMFLNLLKYYQQLTTSAFKEN